MANTSDLDAFLEEELTDPEMRARFAEIAVLVDFGLALAVARGQRRMSQKMLAERVGVARSEIDQIEKGNRAPALAIQVALVRALNARLEFSANGYIGFVLLPRVMAQAIPVRPRRDARKGKIA